MYPLNGKPPCMSDFPLSDREVNMVKCAVKMKLTTSIGKSSHVESNTVFVK